MNDHLAVVKGVDFDFQEASQKTINQIANEFGGESYFDPFDQRVTYMFNDPYVVPLSKIEDIHESLCEIGRSTEERHGCRYIGNELYLSTSEEGVIRLSELGIDFHLRYV